MPPTHIEIFFDYISPFPYFLNEYIIQNDVENQYNLTIEWTPVFLGTLHPENNNMPLNATDPRRIAYSAVEVKRYVAELKIPYVGQLFKPIGPLRAALAAKEQGLFSAFHTELYRRIQGQGLSPDDSLLADTIKHVGGDGERLLADCQKPAIKQALIANAERAKQVGVFGVPHVIHDGEPFWGYSHFQYLLKKLTKGGSID